MEEKKYTINSTEELKGKRVKQTGKKTSTIKTVILTAIITALLLIGGSHLVDYIQQHNTAIVMQEMQEGEFNINDKNEIITRGTDMALDLRAAGYEIDGEDALYFMLFAGNDDLREDFIRDLNLSDTTERTITDSVDKTLIAVGEAVIGGKEVSLDSYFPNEKDQKLIGNILNIMSHWNTADKQQVAAAMLELNDYMFIKGQYQEYSPQAVVTYIKLFRFFDILTINSGYTLANDDMRNLIYIDQECDTKENEEGIIRSIHSEQYAVVKEILNEKFNGRVYDKDYEDGLGYEIITEIDNRIKTSGIELGTKTDVQAERDKNNNVIYADDPKSPEYVPPISKEEKEQIVKDPTTGEEYIYQPATEEEKKQQREEIEEQIKEEEQVDTQKIQAEWQSGHDAGFMDGVEGKAKASMSGKSDYYKQGYDYGYGVGYDMYAMSLEEDVLVDETFVPTTERVVEQNTTSSKPSTTPTTPSTNSNTTTNTSEESSFQFVDGFYESDGIIFDSEGNIITDIDGNPLVIPGVNDNEKTR